MFGCLNVPLKPAVALQKLLGAAAAAWAGLAEVQEDSPHSSLAKILLGWFVNQRDGCLLSWDFWLLLH